ncbi:CoxG family protein [Ktedonospora formicarum]|uniref:Carbon monoxide dehydrogenase n=1 Tax=Ktedonospora formicarum TaxID=2778364 RepID=A0A8J3I3N7_9CHLR|nr:carbon monoxide dehydrogenase subunit G [Ktedonospora formicarum]GHO46193.1 hypothetical protein KSX_43560 [Ktedonospora formicarum]
MEFAGEQKLQAQRANVFNALLNPEVLKKSIPSCQGAEYVELPEGRFLKITVNVNVAILNGTYDIYLHATEIQEPSHLAIEAEPQNSLGKVATRCVIDLADDAAGTLLSYNVNAALSGKLAAVPEFAIKPAVKGMLDQFFKNFEKQIPA